MIIRFCAFFFAMLVLVTLVADGLNWVLGEGSGLRSARDWWQHMSPASYAWAQQASEGLLPAEFRQIARRFVLDWPAAGVLAVPLALSLILLPLAKQEED